LERFFQVAEVLPLSDAVVQWTIQLRQRRRMTLGDAIVAGGAWAYPGYPEHGRFSLDQRDQVTRAAGRVRLTPAVADAVTRAAELRACVPCMLSGSGVKVPCPSVRGAEGQGKCQGVTARWGLKAAWSACAGRGTRT